MENSMNTKIRSHNKSGFKGITWGKETNKWKSQIRGNGKNKNLGRVNNIQDAVKIRVKKAEELFGEFKNSCEKEININITIPTNTKINLNINIKTDEDLEIEHLERELDDII